jgi:hypothetical protein
MKTKTCEALMYGKTIFGTNEAFEGYNALDLQKHDWLCNNVQDFVTKINAYLEIEKTKINYYSHDVFINNYSNDLVEKFISKTLLV